MWLWWCDGGGCGGGGVYGLFFPFFSFPPFLLGRLKRRGLDGWDGLLL